MADVRNVGKHLRTCGLVDADLGGGYRGRSGLRADRDRSTRRLESHGGEQHLGDVDDLNLLARRPLGLTVIGGLAVSQIMTLYLTPVVYTFMARFTKRMKQRRDVVIGQPEVAPGFSD